MRQFQPPKLFKDSFTKNGGKGANQAVASALAGTRTVFAGQMGQDSMADQLIQEMLASGLDLGGLQQTNKAQTGQAIIMLNQKGDNSIVIIGGANMDFDLSQLPQKFIQVLDKSQLLQIQMEVPYAINVLAAQQMSKKKKFVMLDCGGRSDKISQDLIKNLTFISPNETELERIIGEGVDQSLPDWEQSLINLVKNKLLVEYQDLCVLLKLGTNGSLLICKDFEVRVHSAPHYNEQILQDYKIVDTVGAGDCFTSTFCSKFYSLCKDKNIKNVDDLNATDKGVRINMFRLAMQFATSSAFLCITKEGAMPSMPKKNEVDEFIVRYIKQ